MGLCRARDAKRLEIEKKEEAKKKTVAIAIAPAVKPKQQQQANFSKPLSYEELMKKADLNAKNTLSVSDLKMKSGPSVNETIEFNRSNQTVSNYKTKRLLETKSLPITAVKKPVKVIKRNMQPRTETSDLVVLNQKKRDLRSIEEIQFQLKQQQQQKPPKQVPSEDKDPELYYAKNYSSIISSIFGYDKNKYVGRDDDDLLEMEADYRTVMAEEARSSRIGKEEDLQEELREMERKRKKKSLN